MQFRRYDRGQTNTHTHTHLDTQTDRQTDTLITILRSPIVGGVKNPKRKLGLKLPKTGKKLLWTRASSLAVCAAGKLKMH